MPYATTSVARLRMYFDEARYRTLSPIDTILRFHKLHHTVLLAILRHPVTWLVMGTFVTSAYMARNGVWDADALDQTSFEGADLLVTFMIIFYVGYCYGRFSDMFNDLEQVMRCIINCSAVARTAFKNKAALFDLWRYLNLLHVTAYCGVTDTYTRQNLFTEFCEAHALLISPKLRAALDAMDIDDRGASACNTCMIWALETVHARAEAGDFSAPIHKELGELITGIGSGLARLYSQEYQVLPYIYTHLVSLS